MSDVNANIGVHIDTSQALAELKSLQRQLALFHTSVSKGSASAAAQQRNMQQNLLNTINATGKFSAQMGVVRTSTESFTNSLEKNKFSMREYFRYAGGATKTFGRLFKSEFDTIGKVAEERVKKLQTQYVKLGRDTSGAMQAISITPNSLNMKNYGNQVAVAAQKQALFNQLMKQGSTNLLNFGKNTQWAGRQLMVGFSVPLAYLGTVAAKTFMDLEAQAIRFKRVYGDMFTTTEQTNKALDDVRSLAEQFTKYGVAVVDTMKMAADAAAMGKTGADLTAQVAQATRLAVLGGVEQGQALETTISITNAFGTAAEDLAKKINFLNAVENQTVVSIEDLTIAIPKAGPVVKQLGGDVEDLAFFLTAMKEGGINASEGANALKSGLAALINPTKKASDMLAGFGININAIVEGNQGNVRQTVIDFSKALDTLDPLNRARAIEQLFGKFQFSRLSTLFQNVTKNGTQASKVLGLTTNSVEQLAIMSERELGTLENAVGTKFKAAIQDLKLTLEPIGKTFLEAVTPIAQSIAGLLDKFNNLGDGTKKFIVVATTLVGIIGPALLMTFGLLANGAANIVKLFLAMRGGFLRLSGNSKILSEQTNYLNTEQLEAATVAASLNQAHSRLTQQFTMETAAVRLLRQAYIDATVAAANFARTNPGMMMPGGKGGKAPKKLARGTQYVPGTGNKDTVPAVLTPGEAVIPKDVAQDPRFQPIIDAMVNGNLQGFDVGTENAQPSSNTKRTRRKKVRGDATLTKDGKVFFRGERFTTSSQKATRNLIDTINLQLAEAEAEGGVGRKAATKTILNRMKSLQAKEGRVSASRVFKHISGGKSTSGGASANNPAIAKLRKEINAQTAGSGLDRETVKLKAALASAGLSEKEQADFLRKQESHILKPKGVLGYIDPGKWQAGQVVLEYGGLNNYLNRAGESTVGKMINDITKDPSKLQTLGYTPKQVRQLSYDYAFAKTGKHPTNSKEFQSISRLAKFEVDMHEKGLAKIDKINQAKGVSALAGVRQPSFYKNFYKRVIQLGKKLGAPTASKVSRGKVEGFSREQQRQIALTAQQKEKQTATDIKQKEQKALKKIAADAAKTKSGKLDPTDFGKQVSPTTGRSFPVSGIGGVYKKPDGTKAFVKPMMDEKAALAEMRATEIARKVHGLDSPEQKIKTMLDPTDPTGKRKIIVLESAFNPKFDPTKMNNKFTKDEYFKQLVAANLRADKDLGRGNLSGNVLADVGPAGVFGSASGKRNYVLNLPSMEEQAITNLDLNTPNKNRKKFFAESTSNIARNMTPEQYDRAMKAEIDKALPRLKETIKNFNLDPSEKPVYDAMIKRLEDGKKVDWKKLHKIHVSVPGSKLVVAKGEDLETSTGKQKRVTGQTGKAKPSGKNITNSPRDTRVISKKSVKRVIPIKGMRIAGAIGGYDEDNPYIKKTGGSATDRLFQTMAAERKAKADLAKSIKVSDVEKQFNAEQKSLRRQIQKVEQRKLVASKEEEKQLKSQSQQREQNTNAVGQNTKETLTSKEKLSAFSEKASVGIGAVSALTIAASFAGGKLGEMAQNIMPFVFGIQGIVALLPLLANPWVAAIAGIALLGALVIKMGKDIDKAREEGVNLANAMSMTSKKLVALSVVTGTVSATEAANRRRQNLVSGTVDAQRQFGQNVLQSEFGKGLLADIATQGKAGGTNKEIAQNIANQLSTAVLQGAVTPAQAKSIASALGEQLGSYEIPLLVSGKIVSLLGPNGERLDKEPLQIALEIKKESAKNLQTAFDQAQNNRKQEVTAGGLGTLGAGAGLVAAGAGMAATGVGIIPGAVVAAAGAAAMVKSLWDQNKAIAANAKLDSATIQLGLETIVQNQQLVDGLNQQYDLKIKNAKTEKEISDIQAQRKIDLDKLNIANKQTVNDVVGLSSKISAENFNKAIGTSIDNLYKDASDAVKEFKDIAKNELNDLANTDFKKTIQIGFASGQLTPNAVINLLDASKKVPEIETKIKTVVEKQGFAEASTLLELIGQTGADAKTIDLMLNYINTNEVDFNKDITALDILAKFQKKYAVELDLSVNGVSQLTVANAALSKIEGYPTQIDKTVVQKLAGANPELFQDAVNNFEKLSEGKPLIDKTLLVNYLVGKVDPAVQAAAKAAGLSVPEYIARGFNAAAVDIQNGETPRENTGKRDTVLDDLLLKLKLFRKESVNALGGWKELVKQLGSGKSINAFKGTTNQLQGMGANESLVQFAEGLGAEEAGKFFDKITTKAKSGKLVLNDYGKSLNRLFPTVQAGIYLRQQDQITREQTTQNKALAMLRARGVDAATALELTADAANSAAIISKNLDGKDLEKMIANTKKATAATREFEKALRATQFAADEMSEGSAEKLSENFDYAYLEIERKARDTFKSVNKMSPEAVELSIAVDENAISKIQSEISGINSQIKSYSRTLDLIGRQETVITETYDKKIESVNKQKDALESIKTVNSFLISQQQKQLGLANALTQGDISAAAEAAQAMRAEAATAALDRMTGGLDTATTNLEAQKQREISSITAVVNGQKMTRKQIDDQILLLNDKIYSIEVTQLEPLQAQADKKRQLLSDLDFQIQKEQQSLQINGMTKTEWDLIQKYADATNKHLDSIIIDIDKVASSSSSAAASWASIVASMKLAQSLGTNSGSTNINDIKAGSNDGTITPENITPAQKAVVLQSIKDLNANIKLQLEKLKTLTGVTKMYGGVVKYMATGGAVGSDTVPAMLTPGEFVMNKKASQEFGPLLSMLNESKYPSMIGSRSSAQVPVNSVSTSVSDNSTAVYNYSLGFNINGNNSNPSDIARSVMTEIKRVDAQRIRGQR